MRIIAGVEVGSSLIHLAIYLPLKAIILVLRNEVFLRIYKWWDLFHLILEISASAFQLVTIVSLSSLQKKHTFFAAHLISRFFGNDKGK